MPSQAKSFRPNKRVATRSKNRNKIMEMSWKQYCETKSYMHPVVNTDNKFPSKNINIGQPSAKILNNSSVAKGASKSNHDSTSKGMKQPTPSSFENPSILVEKQNTLLRSTVDGKAKREAIDASQPTLLKAMQGLVPKTTDRLGHHSDSLSWLKKRENFAKDITSAKYCTMKLKLSKDSCTTEGNDRQDETMIDNDKENVKIGDEEGDATKAKHTLDSILSGNYCSSGSTSLCPFGIDLPKSQRELIERNMGQFASCNGKNDNYMSKKRKEPLSPENPLALDDDSNVGVQVDSMSCKQMEKLKRSRVTRKDEAEDGGGDHHVGLEDDTASILKNDHAQISVSSCVEQQCYGCSKPIDKPIWSGIFKTDDKEYVSLDGHLSTKSCEKAWNLSKQLLKVVEVKKLLRLEVWPKAWEVSKPIANDIGIYFFPHEMRQEEGLDRLVREVMQNDLALRAIIGEAEMLIFPSILLSNHHQTFQGKHYLWGVFKRREDKGVVVDEPLSIVGRCEMEKHQNVVSTQLNHMLLGEEPNQEMIQMASVIPLERHVLPPNKSTEEVEASRFKGKTNKAFDLGEEGGHAAEATHVATNAVAFPASHGQINPSVGHTPGRLMGFVVRKTPKVDRIMREIEQEGALVFAMQGEMVGAGSWTGSKATATQK